MQTNVRVRHARATPLMRAQEMVRYLSAKIRPAVPRRSKVTPFKQHAHFYVYCEGHNIASGGAIEAAGPSRTFGPGRRAAPTGKVVSRRHRGEEKVRDRGSHFQVCFRAI